MSTQILIILAVVIVVVVMVVVYYTFQHLGPVPTGPIYHIKSKSNGQYLQWRTGVWMLTPQPGDGGRVVRKNTGYGTFQILYDYPSGKVLLPPNDAPPTDGERRVVLGDTTFLKYALTYNPDRSSLAFGIFDRPVLAGNKTANPFMYTTEYPDQQWDMEVVAH